MGTGGHAKTIRRSLAGGDVVRVVRDWQMHILGYGG